jgi:hypothetical protein
VTELSIALEVAESLPSITRGRVDSLAEQAAGLRREPAGERLSVLGGEGHT